MQKEQIALPTEIVRQMRYIIKNLIAKGGTTVISLVKDEGSKYNLFTLKEEAASCLPARYELTFSCALLKNSDSLPFPHIYHVFDDDPQGRVYMLMDSIPGLDLETLRQRPAKQFSWPEAKAIMAPIFDTVDYLHQQEPPVLHGSIQPATITAPATSAVRNVLVDFGIIQQPESAPTLSQVSAFQAPEQYSNNADTRADIYALGATCYALLTGNNPPDALSRLRQLSKSGNDPLLPISDLAANIPQHIAEALYRAMSIEPDKRFSSAENFWQALNASPEEQFLALPAQPPETPITHQVLTPVTAPSLPARSGFQRPAAFFSRTFVAVLALVLLIGVSLGVGLWFFTHNHAAISSLAHHQVLSLRVAPPASHGITYPIVTGRYDGVISDLSTNTSTNISLITIQQSHGNISGYVQIGSKLPGSGTFSGTITTTKYFYFIVTDATGHATLFFEGAMQSSTSLSGDFYRCSGTRGDNCSRSRGGYGIWNVVLAS